MADELSIKITVSGTDYFVSDDEFLGLDGNFHYAFVNVAPTFTLSPVNGGYIEIETGTLVLDNLAQDSNHPFGSTRYTSLLTTPGTAYACTINTGVIGYDWVTGVLIIDSITSKTLTFSIHTKQFAVNVGDSVTDNNGASAVNPFSYGDVTHRIPVIRTGGATWANPTGLTSDVTVYEDGTQRTISFITATTITLSDYSGDEGQVSISVSVAKTLKDFFDYVALTLGLTNTSADVTRAINAVNINVKIYEIGIINLIDLANEVAKATNHVFYISPDPLSPTFDETLFLIDKEDTQTATVLDADGIEGVSYKPGFPLGKVSGFYAVQTVENNKLVTTEKVVNSISSDSPLGEHKTAPVFADTEGDSTSVSALLNDIRYSDSKTKASALVPGIQNTWRFGDYLRFDKHEEFLRCTFQVLSLTFNLADKTTLAKGPADLSEFIFVI